ncbi:MAG: hypothetical protein FP816_10775 [Desulfobacteraceae bacterium]|nr:hypothetical protein [Desulfobacteraceae bacterium]
MTPSHESDFARAKDGLQKPMGKFEGTLNGKINGKSVSEIAGGCDKIPVEIYDYYHNKTGSTTAVPDGDGKNCRYCFSVSKPMYYATELPTFL